MSSRWKCPKHKQDLEPVGKPFPHWRCPIKKCDFVKPAKMRTNTEKRTFNQLEE